MGILFDVFRLMFFITSNRENYPTLTLFVSIILALDPSSIPLWKAFDYQTCLKLLFLLLFFNSFLNFTLKLLVSRFNRWDIYILFILWKIDHIPRYFYPSIVLDPNPTCFGV